MTARRRRAIWSWWPVAVAVLFLITGLAGTWLTPADPAAVDLTAARAAPSGSHLLGTDQLGRDELSRLIAGARGSALAVVLVLSVSLLAAALAGGPDLLIADEPTSALDATAAVELVALLRRLQEQLGLALVIVTHELGVAARLASRVAVFDQGRIVEQADLSALLTDAQHPTTMRLLAAAGLPALSGEGASARRGPAPGRPGPPLLEVRGLRVEYPRRGRRRSVLAVDGVDLDLPAGAVLGVVGNSGCGKSSLARALVGIEPRARGSVRLGGHPVRARDGRAQLVFQDPTTALDRRQSIGAALSEALRLSQVPAADLGVVEQLADQILIMHDGRVVEVLSTQGPAGPPRHAAARELARARTFFSLAPPVSIR